MRPFNLEEALAGKPVITRDGRKVTEIYHFKTTTEGIQSVLFVVDWYVESCNTHGRYNIQNCAYDLFMAPESIDVWVNVWRQPNNEHFAVLHKDEKSAEYSKSLPTICKLLKTEKITIEL